MTNNFGDLQKIRQINGRKLLSEYTSKKEFAEAAGIAATQVSGLFGSNGSIKIGDRIARRLEDKCFKPRGWMDMDHEAEDVEVIPVHTAAKCIVALVETLHEHDMTLDEIDHTKLFYLMERIFSKAHQQKTINRHFVHYMLVSHQMAELKKS